MKNLRPIFLLLFALQVPAILHAQIVPPSADPLDDKDIAGEEIITLDEFQVSSTSIKDEYIATESTTGTRLAEKIVDIPFSIQSITDQFVQDFQLYEEADLMAFVGGATVDTSGGSISTDGFNSRIRGFSPTSTRDGLQSAMPGTPSNTMQVDFIRGPKSTEFGRASPGGIVNKITNRPGTKFSSTLSGSYGEDGYRRLALTSTGPLAKETFGNKLFYRAYLEWVRTEGYFGPAHTDPNDRYYAGLSLLYKFRPNTSLYANFEYQPQRTYTVGGFTSYRDASNPLNGFIMDASAADGTVLKLRSTKGIRGWTGIGKYNSNYAPNQFRDADFYGANFLLEHRFNRVWSHRSALQGYIKDTDKLYWQMEAGSTYLYDAVRDSSNVDNGGYSFVYNGTTAGRTPYKQDQYIKRAAAQTELLGIFRRQRTEHKILLAIDASYVNTEDLEEIARTSTTESAPVFGSKLTAYFDDPFRDPAYRAPIPNNPGDFFSRTDTDYTKKTLGALASYRISLLRNRLKVMGALRFDYYTDELINYKGGHYPSTDPDAGGNLPIPDSFDGKGRGHKTTYSAGCNYEISPKFLVYVGTASSYNPQETVDNGLSKVVPPQEASSVEIGFKGASPDNKFGYTFSLYDMALRNIAIANSDYNVNLHAGRGDVAQYDVAGKQESRGFDFSLTYKIKQLTLGGSGGYCHNRVRDAEASATARVGRPRANVSKLNASLWGSYKFRGYIGSFNLNGLTAGLAATWRDRCVAYYETDAYFGLEMPSLFLLQGYIRYRFKTGKTNHSVALNFKNLLDKEYYASNGRAYYGRTIRCAYSITF